MPPLSMAARLMAPLFLVGLFVDLLSGELAARRADRTR
jgi:hypothetical protein